MNKGLGARGRLRARAPGLSAIAETAAMAACNSLGYSVSLAVPFWVVDLPTRLHLPPWWGGVAASLELLSAALANVAAAAFLARAPLRASAAVAVGVLILGSFLAAADATPLAFLGLALIGSASGTLLAVANRCAARARSADRIYAVLAGLHLLYGVLFFLIVPALQLRFGPDSIFVILAVIAALFAPGILGLPRESAPVAQRAGGSQVFPLRAALALLALALLFVGQEGVLAYIIPLGAARGLDRLQVAHLLAFASGLSFLAPVAAAFLAGRVRYAPALAVAALLIVADMVMIWRIDHAAAFCAGVLSLQWLVLFCVPFCFAYLSRLDDAGRGAAMGPAMILFGAAFGPALGGWVASAAGPPAVAAASAIWIFSAAAIFLLSGLAARGRQPFPGTAAPGR